MRSRAAAAILSREGFKEVYSMEGGITAWKGFVAEGIPEAGMAYFRESSTPDELIALAWFLEEGSRQFYLEMAERSEDQEGKKLFQELTAEEEHHQSSLLTLYQSFSDVQSDGGFPRTVISPESPGEFMEGGIRVDEALKWAKGRRIDEILQFSISLETNSMDLYIKMGRKVEAQKAKQVFEALSHNEKRHLDRLTSLLEKRL